MKMLAQANVKIEGELEKYVQLMLKEGKNGNFSSCPLSLEIRI